MVWIKICGMTNPADALAAAEAGADAIGMLFAPSKRRIGIEQGKEIARALPQHVEKVGLFYDESASTIEEIAEEVGLLDTVAKDPVTGVVSRGGTGQIFDWSRNGALLEQLAARTHVIVAGGLSPVNVGDAVRIMHPWGVDVCSGVEREPGKKDVRKLREFVAAARAATP